MEIYNLEILNSNQLVGLLKLHGHKYKLGKRKLAKEVGVFHTTISRWFADELTPNEESRQKIINYLLRDSLDELITKSKEEEESLALRELLVMYEKLDKEKNTLIDRNNKLKEKILSLEIELAKAYEKKWYQFWK